jgi:hypothetical protein
MEEYYFKTRDLGVSITGLHLIRNGFNYKTYRYSDISSFEIGRGKEIKNWIVLLIVGTVLMAIAVAWVWFWRRPFPI